MIDTDSDTTTSLIGVVESIIFHNPENCFTIAKVKEPRKSDFSIIVGTLSTLHAGQTVSCTGEWKHKSPHGWQFQVESYQTVAPKDQKNIQKYLESGLIKGIGPKYAEKIIEIFQEETLNVIECQPNLLCQVPGIGPKRLEAIVASWKAQAAIRELLLFLQPYGVSSSLAQKIFKRYGDSAIEKLETDPYLLAREVHGIGFKRADDIASKMGIEKDSPLRIDSAIEYFLKESSSEGHSCYPEDQFILKVAKELEIEPDSIPERIQTLSEEERIVAEALVYQGEAHRFLWPKGLYIAENAIATRLKTLVYEEDKLRPFEIEKACSWAEGKMKIEFASNQSSAIIQAFKEKVLIITGGPGTGKSTITKAIALIAKGLNAKIKLTAPTGRAAKRLSELNQMPAQTIHQLLEVEFKSGGFKRNRENPIESDLLIIDEASMIDTWLFYQLVKAIPDSSKVILIGDIDQLPSVGAGTVLKDLIDSKCLPTLRLNEIFRQAAHSKITTCAHEINKGIAPIHEPQPEDDFFFLHIEDPEKITSTILSLVCQRLTKSYGLDPIRDIQVLCPMKRGIVGSDNLNYLLQERIHNKQKSVSIGYRKFFIGDKVMQIRNNYDKEIFNGDLATIESIDSEDKTLTIRTFDERYITYDYSELDELQHAYAVSVHKYQGSECPCIIMPVHSTHAILLYRNLLYTAVTRGKQLVILIGSKKATQRGVVSQNSKERYTGLMQAMSSKFGARQDLFKPQESVLEKS